MLIGTEYFKPLGFPMTNSFIFAHTDKKDKLFSGRHLTHMNIMLFLTGCLCIVYALDSDMDMTALNHW